MMSKNKNVSFKTVERGTSDEFEILKQVVNENPSIRYRVVEILRERMKEMNREQTKEKVLRPEKERGK